ncbi:MAG: thiamine biosynthesis protein ThiS [Bacteroidetes bacterium GWF2_33_38]|nr:MAG: thiamine biosynthesis protein ThiS [Bacteroidetes bacterium GWF2_33_38]OFY88848.1 MAG: thiamine biosynthesis protein ThiS [Bacteroidetes bacterium RIFOXYA2_FULL_33_7]
MKIVLNNREEIITSKNITITELLKLKNYTFKMLVIKLNDTLVKKEDYQHTLVNEGDKIDILHLISGG